ncbi:hypothetical protein D9613_003676 [Agrocybe pediades]|uniref:Uncharacterized protein n=1 Tax=Agrocybe pediades TaxID=84607 RepID=A0A8H4QJS5_9AGAR|nr:hypothetical protein D9613_003676 [Agrocybe pediades]
MSNLTGFPKNYSGGKLKKKKSKASEQSDASTPISLTHTSDTATPTSSVTTPTFEAPWEDFSNHPKDFKILKDFIEKINLAMLDGRYVRYCDHSQHAEVETDGIGAPENGDAYLDKLVVYYQQIGLLPDLSAMLPRSQWIRPTFYQRINRSIAYSMEYQLPPRNSEEDDRSTLKRALVHFIREHEKIFNSPKNPLPYKMFCVVEAFVWPRGSDELPGMNTTFGHADQSSRHPHQITEAERVLGRLFRRALVFPLLMGNVPQKPKAGDTQPPPDQCSEVISLPFILDPVKRYLKEHPEAIVVVNCLAMPSSEKMGKTTVFCSHCDERARTYVKDYDGLRIVDLADDGITYDSDSAAKCFAKLNAAPVNEVDHRPIQ